MAPASGRYRINGRTLTAPIAAFTMAGLLFFYSRTSIQAARLNAQKHREADGGQMNWRNESLRRHGQLDKVQGNDLTLIKEAFVGDKPIPVNQTDASKATNNSEEARTLEEFKRRQRAG